MNTPPPSPRRVTAADVARSLGVSRATVGFVLNDTPGQTISEGTRARVLAEAQRLGYRPHTAARALVSGRSRIVLLLIPDWPLEHTVHVNIDETRAELHRAGYALVTVMHRGDGDTVPLWETLQPDVALAMAPLDAATRDSLARSRTPLIEPGAEQERFGTAPALESGARRQVLHLAEQGRRRLAYAAPEDPRLADLLGERLAAARDAARELGLPAIRVQQVTPGTAAETLRAWREEGVDGVLGYNDETSALVLGAAVRAGLEVPGQLAVVGHDNSPIAALMVPSLSSVHVDAAGLGRYMAQLALSAIRGEDPPLAGPAGELRLVRRESS